MHQPCPVLRGRCRHAGSCPCFQDNNHYSGSHSKASFTPSPGSKADPSSSKSKKKQQATQVTLPLPSLLTPLWLTLPCITSWLTASQRAGTTHLMLSMAVTTPRPLAHRQQDEEAEAAAHAAAAALLALEEEAAAAMAANKQGAAKAGKVGKQEGRGEVRAVCSSAVT